MIINRPTVLFGAAFLMTVLAALFAPFLLLFISIPCAFALLFLRSKARTLAVTASLGCFTALLASGVFAVHLENSRELIGSVQEVSGSIFYENNRQMAIVTNGSGKKMVAQLFPFADGLETGDGITGSLRVNSVAADGGSLLSGGLLFSCAPVELKINHAQKPPLSVRGMLLRDRLCGQLRTAAPIAATDTTVALLFSVKEHLSPAVRTAFAKSGMSHLLAVSGLHLSILVWTLVAAVKRLGGGSWTQAVVGSGATLFVLFAAGMSPSIFRAAFMTLLTLLAGLVSRKSDGLTSLSVAAVTLVVLCPPVITDLSFLLSFMASAGIILLAPRLFALLERMWISRFSHCGRCARLLLLSVSVSASAQLATAPVVAACFGSLPLLGIVINLVAIPLVYPVLILGFAACLCFAFFPLWAGALLLLRVANLFSALLTAIATFTARLPFCTMPVVFPYDWLPVLFLVAIAMSAVIFPHRLRLLQRITALCAIGALLSVGLSLFISYNSITVASSSVTGSLIVACKEGTLIVDNAQNSYHRTLDGGLLERLRAPQPDILAVTHPYDSPQRVAAAAEHYSTAKLYVSAGLSAPVELLPGVSLLIPQPYVTEITIGNTKIMKFYATYDTIDRLEQYGDDTLLADRQGNLLSLGAVHRLLRRKNGESLVRIYRNGGAQYAVYR